MTRRLIGTGAALALALAGLTILPAAASTVVVTSNGTWTAYPGQVDTYQTSVQQPINADGSSNFKASNRAVVPVKFSLAMGKGPFMFESVFSDTATANDYAFLSWRSATPVTFADITELSAVYAFTDGDCAGGSLRWSVRLNDGGTNRNLDVHYQPGTNGVSVQSCAPGTSGANLISSTDAIYVTQQFNGTHLFPSSYNNTYADAVAQLGSLPVVAMTLIVDSGWGANGDQVVDLASATVAVAGDTPYSDTFAPQAPSPAAPTCDLPTTATIKVTKLPGGSDPGDVQEATSVQPKDSNGVFRVVDCKLMYNLATSALTGKGMYKVEAVVDGVTASGGATFELV